MKKKFTLMAMFVAFSLAVGLTDRVVEAQDSPRQVVVTAKRFAYAPSEITLKKGQPVVLVIKSADVAHGLRFRELNLNAKIDKGGSAQLSFTPDKVGDFLGHCSVFCGSGHGEMTITLHVVE